MKVLQVIRQGKVGGGESHLMELVTRSRHDSVVVSFTDGPMVRALREKGVPTYVIVAAIPFDPIARYRVRRLAEQVGAVLVHAHGTLAASMTTETAYALDLPFVYTMHGWSMYGSALRRTVARAAERHLCGTADVTIAVSPENLRQGREELGRGEYQLVHYGVDLDRFRPRHRSLSTRRSLGVPNGRPIVGFIARLTEQKNPLGFVRAMASVTAKIPDVVALVVGDGELLRPTEKLARKLGIRAIFAGFRSDVPEVLAECHVYCLPSLWEGLPIGLLEAMACGRPVIATSVDGSRTAIRHLDTGYLVPPKADDALARGIVDLLQDSDLAARLGQRARQYVRAHHDVRRMVEEVDHVYDQLIKCG